MQPNVPRLSRSSRPAARPKDASSWFRRLTGADFPDPEALTCLEPIMRDVWASNGVSKGVLVGFPRFLAVDPDRCSVNAYRILAFAGQESRQFALYYSAVTKRQDMRLRLPFEAGPGAEERARALLADLAICTSLFARIERLGLGSEIWSDLGRYRVALYSPRKSVDLVGTPPLFLTEGYTRIWIEDVDRVLAQLERSRLN